MNTLTIAVLFVCATMAYAAVLPGAPVAVQPVEIFEAAESRGYGGGYGGGHHGGGHHGGGHHGGGHHGGGHHGGGHHHGGHHYG